ncbi:MAG: VOC family protein [Pirellulaceae bacterium]|nr:VOC family protein [Pirellulaceae bacterium]
MSADRTIDYVELPAADFDAVQAFYQTAFGWTFTDYGPEYRAFSDGRIEGGFYHSTERSSTQTGAALIVLYADDLESVQQAVVSAGGKVVREIISFPGGRRFQFTDPHGNELAVWSDKPAPNGDADVISND